MAGPIVISCMRKYVVGRWNPVIEKCEYLNFGGYWDICIDNARTFWNNFGQADLRKYGINHMPHMPVFISKVFVKQCRYCWGGEKNVITPTKLNYWQKLEAIMQI